MTALRRRTAKILGGSAAAMALALAAPGMAQNSDAPVDVTAAPPPSPETIGPSQLRDFNLQGRVTRPADQQTTTPARPATTAPAPPRVGEAVPTEASEEPVGSDETSAVPSSSPTPTTAQRASVDSPISESAASAVTPSVPLEVTTDPAPQPGFSDSPAAVAPIESGDGFFTWPWLAAIIALIAGGAFIAVNRRSRRQRYGDPGRLAFAGLAPEIVPDAKPIPPARPRPDPVPPRAQPAPAPAPRPDPVPAAAPRPAPRPVDDGLIVSTRLKPELNVEFHAERVVVTEQEVLLQFDIVLANVGSAPARDVLVEGRLFTAHVGQDQEIAAFFRNPETAGDRMTSIAPLGRISLKSVARLPLEEIHRFEAGGRKLFVPLIGFNILYRSGAGEGQASASFLVGRGNEQDEKLAPFRIDLGPRVFRGLASRPHSIGLQTA